MLSPFRSPELLQTELQPLLPGLCVEFVACIDSTNSELMRRARAGATQAVLLLAQTQTEGRGRMGRRWSSATSARVGDSLTFSLGLPLAPRDWSGLSLAVGVALATGLEVAAEVPPAQRIGLKWPNDLWWRGRKLAGILIEMVTGAAGMYAVIGVGINIVQQPDRGFATQPACLRELWPGSDAALALQAVAGPLLVAVDRFAQEGLASCREEFALRDALAGLQVGAFQATAPGTAPLVGLARGIDASGALLLHTSTGMHRIFSSEVSLRRLSGAHPVAEG